MDITQLKSKIDASGKKIATLGQEYARAKAIDSKLLESAEAQKNEILEMLKTIIQATGWKVVIKNELKIFQD